MTNKTNKKFLNEDQKGRSKRNLESKFMIALPIKYFPICKHGGYCHKLQLLKKAHCSEDYAKTCGQVKRFYDRYGEQGNQMGVGS